MLLASGFWLLASSSGFWLLLASYFLSPALALAAASFSRSAADFLVKGAYFESAEKLSEDES